MLETNHEAFAAAEGEPLWDDDVTCRFLGCGRTLLWKLQQRPDFPKPIRIGKRWKRWVPASIRKWTARQQREAA